VGGFFLAIIFIDMPYKDKEKRNANSKKWRKNNPEKVKAYNKTHNSGDIKKVRDKVYREENKDKIAARKRERRKLDPAYKFISTLRSRQGKVLRGFTSTTAGLGCTSQELRDHLAGMFQPGMTFDNHGRGENKWHMDHIIPLDTHEKDSEGNWDPESKYNKKLIHYTNLQPLWEKDNLEKGSKNN
jgi:hypothetical protein